MIPISTTVPTRYPTIVTWMSADSWRDCCLGHCCWDALLGPIDSQLGESPAASLLKVVEQKPISEIDDEAFETLMKADVGQGHCAGQATGGRRPHTATACGQGRGAGREAPSTRCLPGSGR